MFTPFLYELRTAGVPIGGSEWLTFLDALGRGLATDLDGLYRLGRALLCHSEGHFDAYDRAFASYFEGAVLPEDVRDQLAEWLNRAMQGDAPLADWSHLSPEELWKRLLETLRDQKEEHNGGSRWVGTAGNSPFGHSGRAVGGIRIGGPSGGGRGAVRIAMERQWANYRSDRTLDVRDLEVVLRSLRSLSRDGRLELDLDETIDETARNAGDITLVERPERKNRLKVVLLMDAGGSMAPHADKVERLFSAARRVKTFREFRSLYFHNCVYQNLYDDIEQLHRTPTDKVLAELTPAHRLVFVGDASMAPYELFNSFGWPGDGAPAGIDWLRRLREHCPASVWLNPDPQKWWQHPTVSAIGRIFPMFELTVEGVAQGMRRLRAPH